jgi:hypothetical protein
MTDPRTWWADHGGRVAAAVRGQMVPTGDWDHDEARAG